MIACLTPSDDNYEENLSTLNYAAKASGIENKPTLENKSAIQHRPKHSKSSSKSKKSQ